VGGSEDRFLARDAVAERLACVGDDDGRQRSSPQSVAEVDLLDTFAFGDECPTLSRAPIDERPSARFASANVKVSGRVARVRVRCTTSSSCTGRLTLKLARNGARSVSKAYRVAERRSATVRLTLRGRDARRTRRAGVFASASLKEQGVKGARTESWTVRVKRA
jgi:hypothetical protein